MENIRILDWDTGFFGYKTAMVTVNNISVNDLEEITLRLTKLGVKLAYLFVSPEDSVSIELLSSSGIFLADEKVTFTISAGKDAKLPSSANIYPYDSQNISGKLVELTLQSGIYSRFRVDTRFINGEYERLYTEWIKKSVNKKIADEVLVYREQNDIFGFITLAMHGDTGSIGLIAVDESQRGKAVGKKLINAGLDFFRNHNMENVDVVTQKANTVACRFYETCGFGIKSTVNIYHLWTN